jgi:hypothetical protein
LRITHSQNEINDQAEPAVVSDLIIKAISSLPLRKKQRKEEQNVTFLAPGHKQFLTIDKQHTFTLRITNIRKKE